MTKAEFTDKVKAEFKRQYPDWVPEHGPREIDRAVRYMLDECGVTLRTPIRRAAKEVAEFMGMC